MERARLTNIGLKLASDAVFAIGDELEAGHHAPHEILAGLVERGLAEWVTRDGVPAELAGAIAAYRAAFEPLRVKIVAMVDAAEAAGTQAAARAVIAAFSEAAPADFADTVDGRIRALFVRAEAEDEPLSAGRSPATAEPGADAAPEAAGGESGPASAAENSSATTDAPASGDAALPLGGSDEGKALSSDGPKAGETSGSDASPAARSARTTPKKSAPRKGAKEA